MGLLVFYVLLALGVSFLCSVMEAALLSVTPSFVAAARQEGDTAGQRLHELKEDIDRPLAAILSLNTVAHTVGAAGAGAQAEDVFGGGLAVTIFAAVLTLAILVLSEIIPKSLGAMYWRELARPVATALVPVIWVLYPLVLLSQAITRLLSRGREKEAVSRDEIRALTELGHQQGIFEEEESRILRGLFRFRSLRVLDIMTPRIVLFNLPEELTVGQVVEEHDEFRFSRIPVYDQNPDDVTGYVLKDDILLKAAQEEHGTPLQELRRELLVVHETLPLPELFERLLDRLDHVALVVDEYGGVAGLVTMEDVVETLLGLEIVDEADSAEDMQVLARQQWYRRAERLGFLPDDLTGLDVGETSERQRELIARLGITGGGSPSEAGEPSSGSPKATPDPDDDAPRQE